jgi:hypothetical protein
MTRANKAISTSAILLASFATGIAAAWQSSLASMPLNESVAELNRTNCVRLMLAAFQPNDVVKGLIFMPGATDEFYMFRRARAALRADKPTLLDAIEALTNQTYIRVSFRSPLLLLHTDEDPLEPVVLVEHENTADKLRQANFPKHVFYDDRDWDHLQPILKKSFRVDVRPWRYSYDSWHFYRHSFAGWNMTGWEALQAVTLAGKTRVKIQRRRLVFEGDERVRATPKLEAFPK